VHHILVVGILQELQKLLHDPRSITLRELTLWGGKDGQGWGCPEGGRGDQATLGKKGTG
jgi:hypothetical protein